MEEAWRVMMMMMTKMKMMKMMIGRLLIEMLGRRKKGDDEQRRRDDDRWTNIESADSQDCNGVVCNPLKIKMQTYTKCHTATVKTVNKYRPKSKYIRPRNDLVYFQKKGLERKYIRPSSDARLLLVSLIQWERVTGQPAVESGYKQVLLHVKTHVQLLIFYVNILYIVSVDCNQA